MNTTPRFYLKPAAQAAIKQASAKHIQELDDKRKLRGMPRLLSIAAFTKVATSTSHANQS